MVMRGAVAITQVISGCAAREQAMKRYCAFTHGQQGEAQIVRIVKS